MKDRPLLTITEVTDDDTGMYRMGEIEYGIHGTLRGYLKNYGLDGKREIINTMGYLMYEVERLWREVRPKDEAGSQQKAAT